MSVLREKILDLSQYLANRFLKTKIISRLLEAAVLINPGTVGGRQPGFVMPLALTMSDDIRFWGGCSIDNHIILDGDLEAMEVLKPVMEVGAGGAGDTMVIGTVDSDIHNVGKRVVGAVFTGAGCDVIDTSGEGKTGVIRQRDTPKGVLVGNMCGLFGDWIPTDWQREMCKVIRGNNLQQEMPTS